MALQVITLGYCQLAGAFSLHTYANNITLSFEAEDLNVTTFGDSWADHLAGIKSGTIGIGGWNDFADNSADETMWGYFDTGTNIAIAARPSSAAISTANPEWQGTVTPLTWSPIAADVGQVSAFTISWPTSGAFVRDVTP